MTSSTNFVPCNLTCPSTFPPNGAAVASWWGLTLMLEQNKKTKKTKTKTKTGIYLKKVLYREMKKKENPSTLKFWLISKKPWKATRKVTLSSNESGRKSQIGINPLNKHETRAKRIRNEKLYFLVSHTIDPDHFSSRNSLGCPKKREITFKFRSFSNFKKSSKNSTRLLKRKNHQSDASLKGHTIKTLVKAQKKIHFCWFCNLIGEVKC